MRPYGELSKDQEPLLPHQFCSDCIIATRGYDFREGQPCQLANDEERRGRYRSAAESLGTAFQCVLKKPNIGSVGHYSHNIVHRRALHIEQFLDFHVSVPALLQEIALLNDFTIPLAFRANSSKKNELSWICNGHNFRELALRPFVVIEILFLEVR